MSHRNPAVLGEWGPNGTRIIASEAKWREPLKWDRESAAQRVRWERSASESRSEFDQVEPYHRHRVFCASMADVFEDRPELIRPRARLLSLIYETPNLDWQILTKRPENFSKLMREAIDTGDLRLNEFKRGLKHWWGVDWLQGKPPKNVWLGVSVENQQYADERIPLLLQIPASVRFLSCEPLLGPINLEASFECPRCNPLISPRHRLLGPDGIQQVIAGGESGSGRRPCEVEWFASLAKQCSDAGVAFFLKQDMGPRPGMRGRIPLELWNRKEFPA